MFRKIYWVPTLCPVLGTENKVGTFLTDCTSRGRQIINK